MRTSQTRFSGGPHRKRKRVCRVCGCTDSNSSECVKLTGCPCHWVEKDLCSVCADIGKRNSPPGKSEGALRWHFINAQRFPKIQKEIMDHE